MMDVNNFLIEDRSEEALISNHLGQFITNHKKELVEKVLNHRTRHVTLVLEDIFQSQNASAVFRTAECFGIQDIHLIENRNKYTLSKGVLKGANKWLSVIHHRDKENNTEQCFKHLKAAGYKVLATTPNAELAISQVSLKHKIAIVMGNELHGLSDYALQQADIMARIPMYGFTESLNLSVSSAICISEVVSKLRASNNQWQLTQVERNQLKLAWYRKLVRNSEIVEKEFLKPIR